MTKPYILLANDDGIFSPGLLALREALLAWGEVEVVAPAVEQSGVGHSITYLSPLQVEERFQNGERLGWAVHGSPADCVRLGVVEFCKRRPDLVVSGINLGANRGIDVLYSGTVAAAIEGAFFQIPSFALSQDHSVPVDYEQTAKQAVPIIQELLVHKQSSDLQCGLWNINFPPHAPEHPRGIRFTSMMVKQATEVMERRIDPRGRPYYWSAGDPTAHHETTPGTDFHESKAGYVTITPMKFDLTDHQMLTRWQQQTEMKLNQQLNPPSK